MPSTPPARRRIAVVLDGPGTPAWQRRALESLRCSSRLEVVAVSFAGRARRGVARRAHGLLERRLFRLGPDALVPGRAAAIGQPRSEAGEAELVVWLAESAAPDAGTDVLYLRHGGRREPVENAFRRAVLRDGAPWVESEALLAGAGGTRVLARTVSAARPYSTTLSRDRALWKIAAMVARAAAGAGATGEPARPEAPATAAPSTAELLARSPWRWLRILAARALFARPWRVLVRERVEDPAAGWPAASGLVRWRAGHAYADPFLFEHEGRHHLFCEEIRPSSWRAVISHVELSADGAPAGPPQPVLEADYHLSYPFVFAHDGQIFMIPETSSQQRVELYRAVSFPREWRREAVLLEGVAASDATLLEHGGRLWLFVNVAVPGGTLLDELHLFSAAAPRGPWEPHPGNPVVSDVRAGRPAGAVQRWGGRLVRPAQDASHRYGGAVSFRQIDELTPERYREHEIARIEPRDLGGRAAHTYACDSRFEAVDLRRRELRLKSGPRRAGGRDRG
jgi:hypothetical protein